MTTIHTRALCTALAIVGYATSGMAQGQDPTSAGRYQLFEGIVQGPGASQEVKVPIMIDTETGRTWHLKQADERQLRWARILVERLGTVPDSLLAAPPDMSR